MDRRVVIGGGIVAVAVIVVGVRLAGNSGAKVGLDDALTHLPPGFTATHGAVSYNALTGAATVRDLIIAKDGATLFTAADLAVSGIGAQDATGTPERIGEVIMHDASAGPYKHIQRINLTGLSLANLRQVMDPSAYLGGKPAWTDKRPVLEHAEIHGIDGEQTSLQTAQGVTVDAKFTIGTVTMDGVRLSQLPAPPDYAANALVLIASVEASMSQDGSTMKDMDFSATGPAPFKGHIGRATSAHFDAGSVDTVSAADITASGSKPPFTMSVASISGHDFDISKLLKLMPAIAADPNTPHPEILNGMHMGGGELRGLTVDYPQGPLVTSDSMKASTGQTATNGIFTIHALTVKTSDRPLADASRQALTNFGMQDFTTDLDEEGGFDSASGQFTLKHCDIDFHDLGTLHITMAINGIPPGPATTAAQIQAAVAQARLVAASVKWDDASLTGRLFKMAAARQGLTEAQLRAGLSMPLASLPVLLPDQPDAAAQVNAFLDGRHSLSITLAPPSPVSLAQWQSTPVPEKAALLGARVSGN